MAGDSDCPHAWMFAALLVFAQSGRRFGGASAYNDVALATCIFAVFYLLQVLIKNQTTNFLV